MVEKKFSYQKPVSAKKISCSSCSAPLPVKALGTSLRLACEYCGAVLDATDPNYKTIQKLANHKRLQVPLPIGTRGKFRGIEREVIGFMVRCDFGEDYFWHEYLLYNPYHGFCWLNCYNGHWTFLTPIGHYPTTFLDKVEYMGNSYRKFSSGSNKVFYVAGEFYWTVKRGDVSQVTDYIRNGSMVSKEAVGAHEIHWTFGQYIEVDELKKSFKNFKPSAITGVGACQPNPFFKKTRSRLNVSALTLAAMVFVLIAFYASGGTGLIYKETWSRTANYGGRFKNDLFLSKPFKVSSHRNTLAVNLNTNVRNNWLWFEVGLVNQKTGATQLGTSEISYYRGSDWSEGRQTGNIYYYKVKPGTYQLSFYMESGGRKFAKEAFITARVKKGAVFTWNFIIFAAILIAAPFLSFLGYSSFETRRWSESDVGL